MQTNNLVRRHYLVSEDNIKKIENISKQRKCSAAEVVRNAIEAYDIARADEEAELNAMLNIVGDSLQEAIKSTRSANRKVSKVLTRLEANENGDH